MLFQDLLNVIDDDEIMVGFFDEQGNKVDDFGIYNTADMIAVGRVLNVTSAYSGNDDDGIICISVEV